MSLLDSALARFGYERRSKDPFSRLHIEGRASAANGDAGVVGIPAVHACVQLIAETIASLPLGLYRRMPGGGKEPASDHPLYAVLHDQANTVQTAMEFREQFVASCLLTGNGYARKEMNARGEIIALDGIPPSELMPEKLVNGRVRYRNQNGQRQRDFIQDEILHLRYRSVDGFTGLSPITIARLTLGIASAHQEWESKYYQNGARPAGVLSVPAVLSAEQREQLRESFHQNYSGIQNHNKLIVMEQGATFQAMSMSAKDSDFVESRRMTMEDIARIYKVPPPMIGILENATYSNISEQSRMLVMHTLRPWLVRIEQAMNASLLTEESRKTLFIEHNAEGLLRGSQKERYEAYRVAREWGWLSVNEIRAMESMTGIGDGGDEYRSPMNSEALGGTGDT